MSKIWGPAYANEIFGESVATRKCLERIPVSAYDFKPHPKSMALGYLTLLVAEMPNWISTMIETGKIDLMTFKHFEKGTTEDVVRQYDQAVEKVLKLLHVSSDEDLKKPFHLTSGDAKLFESTVLENIGITINHWVHHRGQLTVYMRLSDIAVPSLYGPSADDRSFATHPVHE